MATIKGQLINANTKQGLADLYITLRDNEENITANIGNAISDGKGNFEFKIDDNDLAKLFGNRLVSLYFIVTDKQGLTLANTQKSIVWTGQSMDQIFIIPIDIDKDNLLFSVSGNVTNGQSELLTNQKVILVDIDLKAAAVYKKAKTGKELEGYDIEVLGEAFTNKEGKYTINFNEKSFSKYEREMPDVVAYVVEGDTILGRSKISAKKDWTSPFELKNHDVVLTQTTQRGVPEYASIMAAIMPLVEKAKLQLYEIAASQDQMAFLAEESNQELNHINLLCESSLRSNDFFEEKVSHELLYAIARQQISLQATKWSILGKTALIAAIQKSISENIISAINEKSINEFVAKIINLSTIQIIEGSDEAAKQIQEVLSFTTSDKKLQSAFITAQNEYVGSENKFWNEYLPNHPDFKGNDQVVKNLKMTHDLALLTQVHLPLIQEIQVNRKVSDIKQLMSLDNNEWKSIIDKSGVPDSIKVDEETYAAQLQKKLDVTYPTHRLSLMMESNAFGLNVKIQSPLKKFFNSAQDFDISKSNIDKFDHHFENSDNKAELKKELKTIQRLYQISPSAETVAKLKSLKFTSASQIANLSEPAFLKKYGTALGEENAKAVLLMSKAVSSKAQQIGVMIHKEAMTLKPAILTALDLKATIKNHIPNLEELFGTMSYCECDHCRSVYSPAAYLVDVLRFLENSEENEASESPYEVLMTRRPDLAHLKLTCENTNTIIPYIDLVNEILEYYVAKNKVLDENAAYDTGLNTAEELRSAPQNTKSEAYLNISKAVYPFTLPYHQPLDVIHTYLGNLKVNRFESMNKFRLDENTIFGKEYFNFSDEQYAIITSHSDAQLHQKYGYADSDSEITNFNNSLNAVPEFLKRTGVSYAELVDLLKTKFLNPGTSTLSILENTFKSLGIDSNQLYTILVSVINGSYSPTDEFISALTTSGWTNYNEFKLWLQEPKKFSDFNNLITLYQSESTCEIGTTILRKIESIYTTNPNSLNEFFARFHRFVRLWRKLGWGIQELDHLIFTTSTNEINELTINKLALINQIQKRTGIPLNRIATLWGEMDSVDRKSTYHKLFLTKSIKAINPLSDVFAVQPNGSVPEASALIKDHLPAIQAALGINEDDFKLIKSDLPAELKFVSIKSMSDVYKYVLLSKALKLSIADFISIKKWTGSNPFDTKNIKATLTFINNANQIKSSGFSTKMLNYLFGHEMSNSDFAINTQESETIAENIILKLPKTAVDSSPEAIEVANQKLQEELAAQMASVFKVTPEIIFALELELLALASNKSSLASKLRSLQKAALLITTFKLQADEVFYIRVHNSSFGDLNFEEPTFIAWNRIAEYVAFRNIKGIGSELLLKIFESSRSETSTFESLSTLIFDLFKCNKADLKLIQNHFNHTSKTVYFNEVALQKYYSIFQESKDSGIAISKLIEIAAPFSDFERLQQLANDIKFLTKSKYSESSWPSISGKLNDLIRENQKQALISHVMTIIPVSSADELYEHFLIDVQMAACMDTSRIKQGIASVQLFIQRCLLNLESKFDSKIENPTPIQIGITPDQIDTHRWSWMKNYRVWEANRKIFLYPENWLEPEWRDEKTPFFKELESELLQNDITDANVETAFRNYLNKLDGISNLDIVGMHQEGTDDQYKLHIVGRTHALPYHYYYRTYTSTFDRWEAWAKIAVDIKGVEDGEDSGVHLLPIIWKGRLFLFWPEFFQKVETPAITSIPIPARNDDGSTTLPASEPIKYWEIKLAWTELKDGKWTPKTLSKEFLRPGSSPEAPVYSDINLYKYKLFPEVDNDTNVLTISLFHGPNSPFFQGSFVLKDINDKIQIRYERTIVTDYKAISLASAALNQSRIRFSGMRSKNAKLQKRLNGGVKTFLAENNDYISTFDTMKSLDYLNSLEDLANNVYGFWGHNKQPFIYSSNGKNYFVKPIHYNSQQIVLVDLIQQNEPLVLAGIETPEYKESKSIEGPKAKMAEALTFNNKRLFNKDSSKINLAPIGNESSTYNRFQYDNYISLLGGLRTYIPFTAPNNGLQFHTFYHPHTATFINLLNQGGVAAVLNADTEMDATGTRLYNDNGSVFSENFRPNTQLVDAQFALENIDFSVNGAYSIYNWELFFHIPLFVATRLSKNGKYAEAMQWFHYIFDPTTNERPVPGNENVRYWKVYPFKTTITEQVEQILRSVNESYDVLNENVALKDWRDNPFKPHKIAARRPSAYMIKVVLQYIDNLVAWGDDLFRKDTIECINEATQLYVIANHILGKKPEFVPKRDEVNTETYDSLRGKLDDFGNAMVAMENIFPNSSIAVSGAETTSSLLGLGTSFYFCIPANDKMMKYWETVEDRLFKIRHCQNIEGTFRKLALFEPPIDPGLLVQATAAGLNFGDIFSIGFASRSNYRFQYLLQKANELSREVQGLGAALLTAIEKKESEMITRIRAAQEVSMLNLISEVKERQVLEARINLEGLMKNRISFKERRKHYLELLGIDDSEVPDIEFLDEEVDSTTFINETIISETALDVDVSLQDGDNGVKLIPKEKEDLDKMEVANIFQISASSTEALAGILHLIPEIKVAVKPMGVGVGTGWGGQQIGASTSAIAKVLGMAAGQYSYEANRASKMASYIRRDQDWTMQANTATREIIQIDKQILGAQIRVQIAQKELQNHQEQIENSQETEAFLYSKFSNEELYQWQKEQLLQLHRQTYNLAYDLAIKAEESYRFERGVDASRIIQFNWDNHVNGLMSGEKLQFGLRQLEKAYMDDNEKRDYEITKHISIAQLDPMALIELRLSGKCEFEIPEVLYDMDFPGQYFRRIKSVSISMPCIVGPYTAVSAKLIHVESKYRKSKNPESPYVEEPEDTRFVKYNHSDVIAISHAQNDSGVFELNFRDERYVPFEGLGAISKWELELPTEIKQFDYNTISDVVLHIKYTAREGGDTLKRAANSELRHQLDTIKQGLNQSGLHEGLHVAINMKHDLSNEWHLLKKNGTVGLTIDKSRLPYMVQKLDTTIVSVMFVAKIKYDPETFQLNVDGIPTNLTRVDDLQLCIGINSGIDRFILSVSNDDKLNLEELIMVVKYRI